MTAPSFNRFQKLFRVFVAALAVLFGTPLLAETPAVGAKAPDFTLSTPTGKTVQMSKELHGHNLVLVMLRGFPGYQCPYCVKQVHDFVHHAADFSTKNVKVLLVYPGPPADLDQHARDFLAKQSDLPSNIVLVTDPDYTMTNSYGLRWNSPHETAYPSTFILNKDQTVLFEKISRGHEDRLSAQGALDQLTTK